MDLNGEQRDMFMNGMPVEHRTIVMDYVVCARTVQVTPGRWSKQGIGRYAYGAFGYTEGHSKSNPVESSGIESRS